MFRWPKNNTQPWENHETNISVETTYILIDHIIISIYPSRGPWSLMILRAHTVFRYRFSCFLASVRGFLVFEEIDVRVLIPLTRLPTLQAIATCQLWARCSLHDVKWWTIPGGTCTKEKICQLGQVENHEIDFDLYNHDPVFVHEVVSKFEVISQISCNPTWRRLWTAWYLELKN